MNLRCHCFFKNFRGEWQVTDRTKISEVVGVRTKFLSEECWHATCACEEQVWISYKAAPVDILK